MERRASGPRIEHGLLDVSSTKKKKSLVVMRVEYDSVVVYYVLVCRTESGRPAVQSFILLGTLAFTLELPPHPSPVKPGGGARLLVG